MLQSKDTIFFDLFYTLINPEYASDYAENDVLRLSREVWETYAEDHELYVRRATGILTDPQEIVDEILLKMKKPVPNAKRQEILSLREERMRKSLLDVDDEILNTLQTLKDRGWGLSVISNADVIDVMHWNESPLFHLFDGTIFSCRVGCLKPDPNIYKIALRQMNADPARSLFVGDGGSDELKGAQQAGITTILTTHFREWTNHRDQIRIANNADYHLNRFADILSIL